MRRLADDEGFRCEKCGRFASRIEEGNVVHNEVEGQDVCTPCFRDALPSQYDGQNMRWTDSDWVALDSGLRKIVAVGRSKQSARERAIARGHHSPTVIPGHGVKRKTMKQNIYDEIRDERDRQDREWGGSEHDDDHSFNDFIAYIVKHTGKAVAVSDNDQRRQMIRVAALAIAVVEKLDRQKPKA